VKEAASSGGLFIVGLVLVLSRQLWRLVVWLVPPWKRGTKIALGVVGLACVGFVTVVLVVGATVYSIEMDAPRYSANALPPGKRPIEPTSVTQVVLDLRATPDRTIEQRKQAWREKYEGHWVSWKGTVDTAYANTGHLLLLSVDDPRIALDVQVDPLHAAWMEKLQDGQTVHVSGMLWGYDFTLNRPMLADGALVEELAPGQAQDGPL
jgi:hypothetical protein